VIFCKVFFEGFVFVRVCFASCKDVFFPGVVKDSDLGAGVDGDSNFGERIVGFVEDCV